MTSPFATAFDLQTYMLTQRQKINQALAELLPASDRRRVLVNAIRHSLLAPAKRLRPILCLAAAGAVGGNPERALPAACALELIHTYSLIHDDLPALDNDLLRRGLPTCHSAFGEATAILAGDALLTRSFELLSAAARADGPHFEQWLRVIEAVGRAAGLSGMIEGQIQDMAAEGRNLSLTELEQLYTLKTGALIRVAVYAGAELGDGTPTALQHLDAYAAAIGLAFQITDDILNIEGNAAVMGKAAGTDQKRGKNTYPGLLSLEGARRRTSDLVQTAVDALHAFDHSAEPLRALAYYVLHRNR